MPSFQDAIQEIEILVSFLAPMVKGQILPPIILEFPLKKSVSSFWESGWDRGRKPNVYESCPG